MKMIFEREISLDQALMANRTHRCPENRPRSKGIHAQAINRKIAHGLGKLEESGDGFANGSYPLLPGLGVSWEEFRVSHYPEDVLIWQPFELERDGIYGNHDGYHIEHDAIWECKLTCKKPRTITEHWLYLKQGLTYCAMLGTTTRVLYDVVSIYRPYDPVLTQSLVEFTKAEVEQWWNTVVNNKEGVKAE